MRRLVLSAILLLYAATAAAQNLVFVVRHAERADGGAGGTMSATDPDLSDAGRARAQSLAAALKDAKITAIFVTPYKRTMQTAEPLAKALGLEISVVDQKDAAALIDKVNGTPGNVLVVGHSNTVPDVLTRLGIADPPKLADADYDNLFVVIRGVKPSLVRLHFK